MSVSVINKIQSESVSRSHGTMTSLTLHGGGVVCRMIVGPQRNYIPYKLKRKLKRKLHIMMLSCIFRYDDIMHLSTRDIHRWLGDG